MSDDLWKYLCCPSTFHHIYDVMHGLTKEELIKLRDDLIIYNENIPLHHTLDARLIDAIGKTT
jgi:hypothetical protein